MTDLLDRFISPTTLREAIKAKCRVGARRDTISRLIACYAPADIAADRVRDRLPVELIARIGGPSFWKHASTCRRSTFSLRQLPVSS